MRPLRFRRAEREAPEINLIPFIDVLLVILIFLMLSSSYSRLNQVQIKLPVADAQTAANPPRQVKLTVTADGRYAIDGEALAPTDVRSLTSRLRSARALAAGSSAAGETEVLLVISADAAASHQSVLLAMTAANQAGLAQISFLSQRSAGAVR